jgi:hypothetical protein
MSSPNDPTDSRSANDDRESAGPQVPHYQTFGVSALGEPLPPHTDAPTPSTAPPRKRRPSQRSNRVRGPARSAADSARPYSLDRSGESVARPLLPSSAEPLSGDARVHDDDTPLPSLDTLDALPPTALPAFVADLAARQAHLAALQSRAAARLASAPLSAGGTDPRIAPGQRINAKQLAARMGRSLDYVYRHARRWPFTVRDGTRAVAFDEAGYVRWERTRQRGTTH